MHRTRGDSLLGHVLSIAKLYEPNHDRTKQFHCTVRLIAIQMIYPLTLLERSKRDKSDSFYTPHTIYTTLFANLDNML